MELVAKKDFFLAISRFLELVIQHNQQQQQQRRETQRELPVGAEATNQNGV